MKIAIHITPESFSSQWIKFCIENNISYKTVNCYNTDAMSQLEDCDALMWHFHHTIPQDILFAKQLLFAVKSAGKSVFPDFDTMWHFNDKIGQKYLLEAIGAPLVPTFVCYSKSEAIDWINTIVFPKVFKLREGAGSHNVKLVRTKTEALRLVRQAFGSGFKQYKATIGLKESFRKYKLGKAELLDVVKGIVRLVYKTEYDRFSGREKGYFYIQDFVSDNDHDIRVIVIDGKAFAIKRMVRTNDFRASGSGNIQFKKELFDKATLKLAFKIAEKLRSQCVAFDFVYHEENPLVIEISYGFSMAVYEDCPGYWDRDLNWHEGKFNPYGWMVERVVSDVNKKFVQIQGG